MTLNHQLRHVEHDRQALLNGVDGAGGHLRGGVGVVGAHGAASLLAAATGRFVAHQLVDHPGRDATILQPGREGVAQIMGAMPGPLLTPHGGSGSAGAWDTYYWLWPLPPPGRLLIVAEWLAQHITETAVEVDTDPILQAATRALTLWPEEDNPGGPAGYLRIEGGT